MLHEIYIKHPSNAYIETVINSKTREVRVMLPVSLITASSYHVPIFAFNFSPHLPSGITSYIPLPCLCFYVLIF